MNTLRKSLWNRNAHRGEELKRAIIAVFAAADDELPRLLNGYSDGDWARVMWWLDVSGMALYLLHRIRVARAENSLPALVRGSLEERQANNIERTQSLLKEAETLSK